MVSGADMEGQGLQRAPLVQVGAGQGVHLLVQLQKMPGRRGVAGQLFQLACCRGQLPAQVVLAGAQGLQP